MNLEHRIKVQSKDEIGTVAGAFNDMALNLAHAQQELTAANSELTARNAEVERERQVSQSLLLNILPEQVAAELASSGQFAPRYFEDVTILFTDFVGFTLSTEKLAADELVNVLHGYFTAFDKVVSRYGLEKMKTIGDAYFCAGGLPVRTPSHPVDATLAAFEMIREVEQRDAARRRAVEGPHRPQFRARRRRRGRHSKVCVRRVGRHRQSGFTNGVRRRAEPDQRVGACLPPCEGLLHSRKPRRRC